MGYLAGRGRHLGCMLRAMTYKLGQLEKLPELQRGPVPVLSFPKGAQPPRNFSRIHWLGELWEPQQVWVEETRCAEENSIDQVPATCCTHGHDFNLVLAMRKDPRSLVSGPGLTSGHETLGKLLYFSVGHSHPG